MHRGATFPGFIPFWQRRRASCASSIPFGAGVAAAEMFFSPRWHGGFEGGGEAEGLGAGFGVRRPLRYLAFKLDLSEAQMADLAVILDELKIERAQAALAEVLATHGVTGVEPDVLVFRRGGRLAVSVRGGAALEHGTKAMASVRMIGALRELDRDAMGIDVSFDER